MDEKHVAGGHACGAQVELLMELDDELGFDLEVYTPFNFWINLHIITNEESEEKKNICLSLLRSKAAALEAELYDEVCFFQPEEEDDYDSEPKSVSFWYLFF